MACANSALRNRPALPVAAALFGGLLLAGMPATAQDKSGERLKSVEQDIRANRAERARLTKRQRELVRTLDALRKRSVELAKAIQLREADILRVEKELAPLVAREKVEARAHHARQAELARILAVLERLRVNPPILLAARPGAPNDAVRGAIVLKSVAGRLHLRAVELEARLAETRKLRLSIEARHKTLKAHVAALDKARTEIGALTARQSEFLKSTEAEREAAAQRIAALSKQARNLRDLVGRLNVDRRNRARGGGTGRGADGNDAAGDRRAALTRPSALKRFARSKGLVTLPAAGRIAQKYGEDNGHGQSTKGIVIAARTGAQVVAPFDGQVVFAGPFRGYGQILILKHSDGYHSLVAGLARIDVTTKQWVLAGEPVGIVGDFQGSGPRLYLEIRHRGHPINPLPWLAADKRKVNG